MPTAACLLLVDDDEANRELLQRRLQRSGFHADAAESGEEALAMVKSRAYDLILLDQILPGVSGLDVLRRIREQWSDSELPVIMVTALDASEEIVAALRLGANDYITKPLDFPVVLARIETRLRLALTDRELRRTRELYRLAMGASEEGLWDWDLASDTIQCSAEWISRFGLASDAGRTAAEEWFARIHPDDGERVRSEAEACLRGEAAQFETEYRLRRGDGRYGWVESRATATRDSAGRPLHLAGCQTDITVRKTVDPLTALPNREWLEEELASLTAAGRRMAVLLFDLDGFGRIEENLTNGDAGHFLAAVGGRFRESIERSTVAASAVVARAGERQFAVLLRDASGPAAAKDLAGHLQATLAAPFDVSGQSVYATASAGIAVAYAAAPEDDLLRDAAAALRHSREQGIGHSAIFQPFMRRDDLAQMHLEHDLHHAVERSEIEVWYQPKVDLEEEEIVGCEALARWFRPGHGMVPPGAFIPAAERTGVIGRLGRCVLERACRDIAELRRVYPRLRVSVNVSGRQFAEPDLVEQVSECLEAAGLDPHALRLEVTETFLVEDPGRAREMLCRLRALGVGLKLDDFGSGYSSLDYLQKFPFDSIKIDRSFVSRIHASHESAEIVRAVVGLARSLKLDLIAEGIETRAQLDILRELGCRYGQGYWFSPPLDIQRLREFLEEWDSRKTSALSAVQD